jgi:DNA-binding MarR family transcriptional regulator
MGAGQDLAIYRIVKNKKLDQKNLAIKLNITPASVSVIVNKLESEDLLKIIPDEKDEKKFNLFLTEKGQSLLPKIRKSWLKLQKEITNGFTESKNVNLLCLLQKVGKNLELIH